MEFTEKMRQVNACEVSYAFFSCKVCSNIAESKGCGSNTGVKA